MTVTKYADAAMSPTKKTNPALAPTNSATEHAGWQLRKYQLDWTSKTDVLLTREAIFLDAIEQLGNLVVYVWEPSDSIRDRITTFIVVPTGQVLRRVDNLQLLGVVSLQGGNFIFHVFVERS